MTSEICLKNGSAKITYLSDLDPERRARLERVLAEPFPELRPSPRIVSAIICDARALILGEAKEPIDEQARAIRAAAEAIVKLDEMERRRG